MLCQFIYRFHSSARMHFMDLTHGLELKQILDSGVDIMSGTW